MSNSTIRTYARLGKIGEQDEKLIDFAQWDELGHSERFKVAWELVVDAWQLQGKDLNELRFQRSIAHIERRKC